MQNAECRKTLRVLDFNGFADLKIFTQEKNVFFAELYNSKRFSVFLHYALCIMHSTLQNGNRAFSENALLSFCTYFIHKFLLSEIAF